MLKKNIYYFICLLTIFFYYNFGYANVNVENEILILDAAEYERLISEIERTSVEIKKMQEVIEKKYIEPREKTLKIEEQKKQIDEPKKREVKTDTTAIELTALKEQLKIMIVEYEKKNIENRELMKIIDIYKNNLKELMQTNNELNQQLTKLSEEYNKRASQSETIVITKIEEKIIMQPDTNLLLENEKLKKESQDIFNELTKVKNDFQIALNKNTELLNELANQKISLKNFIDENNTLKSENQKLKDSSDNYEKTILELLAKLNAKTPDIVDTRQITLTDEKSQQELKTLKEQYDKIKNDNENLLKMLEIYKNQFLEQTNISKRLGVEIENLTNQLETEKNRNKELDEKIKANTISREELNKYIKMLEDAKNRMNMLNDLVLKKQEEIMELRDNKTDLYLAENQKLREQNQDLKDKNYLLSEQIKTIQDTYKKFLDDRRIDGGDREELNRLKKENEKLKNDLEANNKAMKNFEDMINVLKKDLLAETEKFGNQTKLLETSKTEIANLKNQQVEQEKKVKQLELLNANLKTELELTTKELEKYRK